MSESNSILVIDMGEYYMIYGAMTMFIIIMLLWFFIKSHIRHEGLTNDYQMDNEYTTIEADNAINILLGNAEHSTAQAHIDPHYVTKLYKGVYGDVPVYMHTDVDQPHSKKWREVGRGVYLPNSRDYNNPDGDHV